MKWVLAQVVVLAFVLWLPNLYPLNLPPWIRSVAVIVTWSGFLVLGRSVFDLRRSLAVAPQPIENGSLQTNGIYAYLRHPMYLGVWLVMAGGMLRSGSLLKIASMLVIVAFFVIKVRHEEKLLLVKYPDYKEYQSRVGAFFPKLFT